MRKKRQYAVGYEGKRRKGKPCSFYLEIESRYYPQPHKPYILSVHEKIKFILKAMLLPLVEIQFTLNKKILLPYLRHTAIYGCSEMNLPWFCEARENLLRTILSYFKSPAKSTILTLSREKNGLPVNICRLQGPVKIDPKYFILRVEKSKSHQ